MLKISDSITKIVKNQPFLTYGLGRGLFNLTKLAKTIKPFVEVQTKKPVKLSAVLMALSRTQKQLAKTLPKASDYNLNNMIVHSNLCTVTFFRNRENSEKLKAFYSEAQKNTDVYIVYHQRPSQVSMIISETLIPDMQKAIKDKPRYIKKDLCSIGVQFSESYMEIPGLFHFLISQVGLQGINIYEVFSTCTELVFLVDQKDMSKAIETFSNLINNDEKYF